MALKNSRLELILLTLKCWDYTSCLHILIDKEESIERKDKGITKVQLENCLQNSSFINWMQ